MINNKKITIAAIVSFVAVVVCGGSAYAADLNFTDDTTITLSSISYTIGAGSAATAPMTVDNGVTLTVEVPASSVFIFKSPNGYALTNDQSVTQTCSSNTNIINIVGPLTVAITPNTSSIVCSLSGPGSGGTSTGSTTTTTTTTTDTTPPTGTFITIAGGANSTASTSVSLSLGATGATQMMISNDASFSGASWETYSTTKLWTLTTGSGLKTVYAKFRDAASNESAAVSDSITSSATTTTPVTTQQTEKVVSTLSLPYANPQNADEIAANRTAILSYIALLIQAKTASMPATSAAIPAVGKYMKVLRFGMTDSDINALQQFLKDQGADIYPEGRVTGFFGGLTMSAVGRFQLKYGIVSSASDAGYGQVGPKTRAKINSLLGL